MDLLGNTAHSEAVRVNSSFFEHEKNNMTNLFFEVERLSSFQFSDQIRL